MLPLPLLFLLLSSTVIVVIAQRLVIPPLIYACQPTNVSWDNTVRPQNATSSIGNEFFKFFMHRLSNVYLNSYCGGRLMTFLPNGTIYTITFTNISEAGFSFVPIFHPGSQISVIQSNFETTKVTVEDDGQSDCLLQFTSPSPPSTSQGKGNASEKMVFESNTIAPFGCKSDNFTWSGGVAPYQLSAISENTGISPSVFIEIDNITGTWINTSFPLPASFDSYSLMLSDDSGQWMRRRMDILPPTSPIKDCLLHPDDLSVSPPPSSNSSSSASSPSSSLTNDNKRRQTIIIATTVIFGILFILVLSVLTVRYVERKRREKRLKRMQDRFDHVKWEEVNKKAPVV